MRLQKRTLLLGLSVAAFGALLTSAAISQPSGTAQTQPSSAVGVATEAEIDLALRNEAEQIQADGTYQKVGDIHAGDRNQPSPYAITKLEVDESKVTTTGKCNTPEYALNTEGAKHIHVNVPLGASGEGAEDVGENGAEPLWHMSDTGERLYLSIQPRGTTPDCTVSGAVVIATFETTSPVDDPGDDNDEGNGEGEAENGEEGEEEVTGFF